MFTNKIRILVLILLFIITLIGCNNNDNVQENGLHDNEDGIEEDIKDQLEKDIEDTEEIEDIDEIEEIISSMSLDEKIGQLLIVGVQGENLQESELYQLNTNKVGGFILFSRNISNQDQTLRLLNDLKAENDTDIPLFLAIDEEGGMVSRLSPLYGELPNVRALGDLNDKEISYEYGTNLGKRLRELGLNLNFAPVLDINSNVSNPVIGNRSFGTTAKIVEEHGMELMNGIKSQSIIPTVKHFPGHGDTSVDSHLNLPIVNKNKEELMDLELRPFIKAIDEGVDMIMIAHILYPQLDPDTPSTMSGAIMDELLREELGYKNVIMSDDMTMGAIVENYSIEEASIMFLENGGDILLICHGEENPSIVIDVIKDSIENGELSIDDIDEKLYRILSLKEKYNLIDEDITEINTDEIRAESIDLSNRINR